MTRRPLARPLTAATGALLLVAALAGCTAAQTRPVEDYAGEPKGVDAPASSAGGASWAAWLPGGNQFGIVLYGSSTCPPKVASVSVVKPDQLKAMLEPAPGGVCTHDYMPHTTVFSVPSGMKTTGRVSIELPDATLTLPVRPG